LQVVGVGAQDDFAYAQRFLNDTGVGSPDSPVQMLWEGTGNIWSINQVRVNSAMQLFSHDLSSQSGLIFFNDDGRSVVLDAAVQVPWAPEDSPNLSQ